MRTSTEFSLSHISKPLTISYPSTLETQLFKDIEIYWDKMELTKYLSEITPTHTLYKHSFGVANNSLKLAVNYLRNGIMKTASESKFLTVVYFSGLFHDFGKLVCYNRFSSIHDSVRIELSLRENKLYEIADSIRHTPKLFLNDYHEKLYSISQLIATYSDLCIDRNGELTPIETRLKNVIKQKSISATLQRNFVRTIIELFANVNNLTIPLWTADISRKILK